ncbi:MAG: ankyrin repeat domain-containing protein [Bacteroidota bacterium]
MSEFLIKSSLILAVFWLFYKLVLERESFFAANRLYLLGTLILTFVLPFVTLPELMDVQGIVSTFIEQVETAQPSVQVQESKSLETAITAPAVHQPREFQSVAPPTATDNSSHWGLREWILACYYFGIAIFSLHLLTQLWGIFLRLFRQADRIDGIDYILINSPLIKEPCSFFRYIFIDPERYDYETYEQILSHEEVHIQQRHSIDLLLAELVTIILWFHPLVWLFRKEVEKNIEYQTDDLLLTGKKVEKAQYQMNLLKVATYQKPLAITTNYNQSLIKKRILKMSSKKSNPHSYWKYAFIAPVVFMMLLIMNKPSSFAKLAPATPAITLSELADTIVLRLEQEMASEKAIEEIQPGSSEHLSAHSPPIEEIQIPVSSGNSSCKQLIDAILDEDLSEVKHLLKRVDPNCENPNDEHIIRQVGKNTFYMSKPKTPLVAAAQEGNVVIGRLLIQAGADPQFYSDGDQSPIMAASGAGSLAFVQLLRRQGAEIDKEIHGEGTPMIAAARNGHTDIVMYLHREGADIDQASHGDGSPILVAARGGHTETVRYLLTQGVDIDAESQGEGTPLSVAARSGHLATVGLLLRKGAHINANVQGEGTPLSVAARSGHLEVVDYLLAEGADINAETHGEGTPLSVAARSGHVEVVRHLVSQGADINAEVHGEGTPISVAARSGHLKVVEYLLSQGADINAESQGEGTPLSVAARSGHLETVKFLLANGADINAESQGEGTPLSVAARSGHEETVRYLIAQGADINAETAGEGTPLSVAARSGHLKTVKLLIAQGADINAETAGEGTPLSVATRSGHTDIVDYLLSLGADINGHASGEGSPLLIAARNGDLRTVRYLVNQGASVDQVISGEGTALISAVRNQHQEVAQFLLERGADPYLDTPGNEYAMYHARRSRNKNMIRLLEKYEKTEKEEY